jgi:aspartyl-tRNA(Asn)/glutamyl-tRNA(Gln) amidotransferase subunit C
MGKLTKFDVEHVAKLANLNLSSEETKKYTDQLGKIVDFVSELSEVNTSNLEPTSQTTGLEDVYRVDEIKEENVLKIEEALSGTDKIYNNAFKVNAILNKE